MLLGLALAAAGGWLASLAGIPLPWMLGAIGATLVAALVRLPVASPVPLVAPMRAILGALLGAAITPDLLDQLGTLGFSLLAVPVYVITTAAIGFFYFRTAARMERSEAFFAALPGGLYTMVTFAEDLGISIRRLGLIHTMRVTLIVLLLPFLIKAVLGAETVMATSTGVSLLNMPALQIGLLATTALAGWWLAARTRLPGGIMIIPMAITAALQLSGLATASIPDELVVIAQVVLGASIGGRFRGIELGEVGNAFVHSCGYVSLALMVTGLTAWLLTSFAGISMWAGIIAFAPGGLAEMSLIALTLGLNVGFVVTIHICRILLVVLSGPLIYHMLRDKLQEPGQGTD